MTRHGPRHFLLLGAATTLGACTGGDFSLGSPDDASGGTGFGGSGENGGAAPRGGASGSDGSSGKAGHSAAGGEAMTGGKAGTGATGGEKETGGSGGRAGSSMGGGGSGTSTGGDAGDGGGSSDCGNRAVEAPESCDDGNRAPGDGCSPTCHHEAVLVRTGRGFHCALSSGGTVKCWGDNHYGQLGIGDTNFRGDQPDELGVNLPAVELGTGRRAVDLSVGTYHVCALLDDDSLKCWGKNSGVLGLEDLDDRGDEPGEMGDALPSVELGTERPIESIATGDFHTCVLFDDGAVKCWGTNGQGQLGLGNIVDHGYLPGTMGEGLPAVNLGTGRRATAIGVGHSYSCALLDDESVKCWGYNEGGVLGLGDNRNRGDAPNQLGDALPRVDLGVGRRAKGLFTGASHVCVLLDDASVKCWGNSRTLGTGDTAYRGLLPGDMGDALPVLDFGAGRSARLLATGYNHSCALLDDGALKCWGDGGYGQLGLGDRLMRGDAPNEMGDDLPRVDLGTGRSVLGLSAGEGNSCALLDGADLKCWGFRHVHPTRVFEPVCDGDEPGEMGDALEVVELAL